MLRTLPEMFVKQMNRYEEQLGESINVNIYGSRANDFQLPFAKKQRESVVGTISSKMYFS